MSLIRRRPEADPMGSQPLVIGLLCVRVMEVMMSKYGKGMKLTKVKKKKKKKKKIGYG